MNTPKPAPVPPPTPMPDMQQIDKAKKKTTAELMARSGGRASTIMTDSNGKLGA